MSRWRAQSRERINRFEGQGVDVFTPLPSKNNLERVRQEKVGQKRVFAETAVQYGNLRENLQNHIRMKTPEPITVFRPSSSRKENISDRVRKKHAKFRRSRSREPANDRSSSRGRPSHFSSSDITPREAEKRHLLSRPFDRELFDEIQNRNHKRFARRSQERNSFYSSSREPSIEPPTKMSRKTPTKAIKTSKRGRPKKINQPERYYNLNDYTLKNSTSLNFSEAFSEEKRPTLEQQIIQQPSVALAIQKLYGPKLKEGFPYVPNFLTPEVRNNGEGLPAINYIMNEIFLKPNNPLQD